MGRLQPDALRNATKPPFDCADLPASTLTASAELKCVDAFRQIVEVAGLGHLPPDNLEDIRERLFLLKNIGCPWWVIEVEEEAGLLKTKKIVDRFLQSHHTAIHTVDI